MIVLEENETQRRQRAKASGLIQFFCLINRCSTLWDSVLILITVPFLSKAAFNYKLSPQLVFGVATPSLLDCLNKSGVRRDNKWTKKNKKHARHLFPFLAPLSMSCLTSQKSNIDCCSFAPQSPHGFQSIAVSARAFYSCWFKSSFSIFPNIGGKKKKKKLRWLL